MPGRDSRKDPLRWNSSDRGSRLPRDWAKRRAAVLIRDGHRCQAAAHVAACDGRATDVDHVDRRGGDDLSNLTALSSACHDAKSSREGNAARWGKPAARTARPAERHPGLR